MPMELPPPPPAECAPSLEPLEVHGLAALGVQVVAWVGDEADKARGDGLTTPGVRIPQSALEVEVEHPSGFFVEVRAEEGLAHAGGVEAAEALLGWSWGWGQLWAGRGDVPVTADRELEPETYPFTLRPTLSRRVLPTHATGAGLDLNGVDNKGSASVGTTWVSPTSDAPWVWVRLRSHPQGPLTDDPLAPGSRPQLQVAGSAAVLQSETLGERTLASADLTATMPRLYLSVSWLTSVGDTSQHALTAELTARVVDTHAGGLFAIARGERVVALEEGEQLRHLLTSQLAWRSGDGHVKVYAEVGLSQEIGQAVAEGEDVVDLGNGIERTNGNASIGALFIARGGR